MRTVFVQEEKTLSKQVLRLIQRTQVRVVAQPEKHLRRSIVHA